MVAPEESIRNRVNEAKFKLIYFEKCQKECEVQINTYFMENWISGVVKNLLHDSRMKYKFSKFLEIEADGDSWSQHLCSEQHKKHTENGLLGLVELKEFEM